MSNYPLRCASPRVATFPRLLTATACALLWTATTLVAAENWALRVWQSDDGLPNNQVTGITQTSDGYLWIATYSAVARFDGVRFDEFSPAELALGSGQKITALCAAGEAGIWIGTVHGRVVRLDGKEARGFEKGLPNKPVQTLVTDAAGTLWMSLQGGTVARVRGDELRVFGVADGLPPPETPTRYGCALAVDERQQLWFAKVGEVGVFRDGRFVTLLRLTPTSIALHAARGGGVWIYCGGKLLRLREGQPVEHRAVLPVPERTEATAIFEDRAGGVWIGTNGAGLFHYDGSQIESVETSDTRIACVMEDRKGNIWVGTFGAGLNRIRPRIVALESDTNGVIETVTEARDGTLWAATQNGLLIRQTAGRWEVQSPDLGWPGGRASTVAADADGGVWIGTRDHVLYHWKDGAFTAWRRAQGLAGREVHALLVDHKGDVWLGLTQPEALQRLHNGRFETLPIPEGVRVIRAIAEDAHGDVWVGTSLGILLRVHGDTVVDETAGTTGEPLSIRCLRATPDGALWIGYADEGIGWLKDGRFRRLTPRDGFPEGNVSQIIPDTMGWLWFAGDHGLFKVRQKALEQFALGPGGRPHFIRYGPSEGLFSIEGNFGNAPGACRSRDGRLWIPLRTALAVADPAQMREDTQPPAVVLKRVVVDDQIVAMYGGAVPVRDAFDLRTLTGPVPLPPAHGRIGIDFTALSFGAPENVRFRFRLDGVDAAWLEAGAARTATYSRLPAGDYRFQVQACNSDGVWNEAGAAVAFVVPPFVWQTWWFRLGLLGVFTTATVVIARRVALRRVRARLRQLEQQAAVQRERTRIARDLHDEFGTRLTELGLLAELDRKSAGAPDRADLIGNIRALERDLDTIVWAVNPKNDTLDQLVGFFCRVSAEFLGRSGIRCRLDIPDDLPPRVVSPELRHNVFLVVREAVNNVVKHAGASSVKLAVAFAADWLTVRIENDGRGFVVPEAEAGTRNGLKNMRARIEELGGVFTLTSTPDRGTTIELRVPVPAGESTAQEMRLAGAEPL